GLKEKIKELQRKPETNEKLNLLGRLEFLQRNQDKVKKHKKTIKDVGGKIKFPFGKIKLP
ncbi:hypothetical protein ACVT5J_001673, partial [Campylobacter jejuni]